MGNIEESKERGVELDDKARIRSLNAWIKNALTDGRHANYDRSLVLSPMHTQISFEGEGATVTIPDIRNIRQRIEESNPKKISGTCREIAQWAAHTMVNEKVADSAEVFACATNKESHYVVIAAIDGEKYLVDLGYSQPVLEAIPVDGNDYVSEDYAGKKGTKQAFTGEITYSAKKSDGKVIFTVKDTNGHSTEFPFELLTEELDAKIPLTWAQATGSGYATKVRQNPDGTYRVDQEAMGPEATLQEEFKKLHAIAKSGRGQIKVVFNQF